MALNDSLKLVEDMIAAPPLNANGKAGRGPALGVVLVSDHVKSLEYFLNMPFLKPANKKREDTLMHEFVWDPINIQFATIIRGIRTNGYSPHQSLALAIGADVQYVCGGIIRYPENGQGHRSLRVLTTLSTSEYSGHYGANWTPDIRKQYKKYMQLRTGLTIDHEEWVKEEKDA